jgi:hypothetical protein
MAKGGARSTPWLQGLGSTFVDKVAEAGIYGLAALLVFPLIPWIAVVVAIVCVATVAMRLRHRRKWRVLVLGLAAVLGLSVLNVVLIAASGATKYVVPGVGVGDSLLVREFDGPAGRFALLPLSNYSLPKRWLFSAASERDDRFVVMEEAEETATGYVLHSPSELALARLSAPDGTARVRTLPLPSRHRELVFELEDDGQVNVTPGLSGGRINLASDAGPGRPGLFGRSLNRFPSLEQWRRVAFAEELLRNLQTLEADQIIQALEAESARTSDLRDFLRLAVFRLELLSDRYGGILGLHKTRLFELAPLGNLRHVAALFSEINPPSDAMDDAWFRPFQHAVFSHLNYLPLETVPPPGGEVDNGSAWASAFLLRTLENLERSTFASRRADARAPRDAEDEEQEKSFESFRKAFQGPHADPRSVLGALQQLYRDFESSAAQDPLRLGDIRRMEDLEKGGGSLLRAEVRQWVASDDSRAGARTFLVYEAARERCAKPFARLFGALPDAGMVHRFAAELTRSCTEAAGAAGLAPDFLQRRFLQREAAMEGQLLSNLIKGQVEFVECGLRAGEDEAKNLKCLSAMMEAFDLPFFQEFLDDMRRCGNSTCGVDSFERRLPLPGPRYSLAEYRYASYLALALLDDRYPRLSPTICDSVRRDFAELLQEDRLADRLTVANLHAAALDRCGAEEAETSFRLLREHRLPLARWQRWMLADPPLPGGGEASGAAVR